MQLARLSPLAAILFVSCSPGELDPSLKPTPTDDGGAPGVADDTPLEGCAKYPTLKDLEEKLLIPSCGMAGCHGPDGKPFAPDMKGRPIYPRLLDRTVVYSATKCDRAKDRYIDRAAAPEDSYLVAKVRDAMPACPSGKPGGARMPFLKPALPEEDVSCLVAYVRALVKR